MFPTRGYSASAINPKWVDLHLSDTRLAIDPNWVDLYFSDPRVFHLSGLTCICPVRLRGSSASAINPKWVDLHLSSTRLFRLGDQSQAGCSARARCPIHEDFFLSMAVMPLIASEIPQDVYHLSCSGVAIDCKLQDPPKGNRCFTMG
ncbi:hypothetical protein PtA15_11A418 [Puccinia triticina]|uniref:Uncharacterized protein n=1 Tax=Puccinia triticina TaxID=208348 RepID=A0ABY7D472_9BASI|nr:uncharacterized protein PtA15_11A418 [Puccinia triticina]WAQ89727.1 hypothetical protein PtA15_11A418 [Puccinia triticina]WAR59776.1 hypothetical protein PtB15_11B417 [Puccinia triticina]